MTNDTTMKQFVEEHTIDRHLSYGQRILSFEPGNGYKYEIAVIPVLDFCMGMLGSVSEGYLVIDGGTGNSYLFQPEDMLMAYYVNEKLLKLDNTYDGPHATTICAVTALLGYALDRVTNVVQHSIFGIKD